MSLVNSPGTIRIQVDCPIMLIQVFLGYRRYKDATRFCCNFPGYRRMEREHVYLFVCMLRKVLSVGVAISRSLRHLDQSVDVKLQDIKNYLDLFCIYRIIVTTHTIVVYSLHLLCGFESCLKI